MMWGWPRMRASPSANWSCLTEKTINNLIAPAVDKPDGQSPPTAVNKPDGRSLLVPNTSHWTLTFNQPVSKCKWTRIRNKHNRYDDDGTTVQCITFPLGLVLGRPTVKSPSNKQLANRIKQGGNEVGNVANLKQFSLAPFCCGWVQSCCCLINNLSCQWLMKIGNWCLLFMMLDNGKSPLTSVTLADMNQQISQAPLNSNSPGWNMLKLYI